MKKKPFLLLEILIGLFLVILIGIPLLTKPIFIYRNEITALKEIEGERLADWTFVEIKEKLLKNEISWEQLPKEGEKKNFSLNPLSIHLPEAKRLSIQRSFSLHCHKGKERDGQNHELYRLVKVHISFDPPLHKKKKSSAKEEFYTYDLFIRRLPK